MHSAAAIRRNARHPARPPGHARTLPIRKQIQDILLEERNGLNAAIIGNGHQMAMLLLLLAAFLVAPHRGAPRRHQPVALP